MFMALQREAMASNLTLADLFPTSGLDNRGTMQHRNMPNATVMKLVLSVMLALCPGYFLHAIAG